MKVHLLDRWTDVAKAELAQSCEVFTDVNPWPCEGIIATLGKRIDALCIDGHPNLRFIATCTTGLDHIDTDYARSRGIEIISLQGDPFLRDVWATAEHTMALILALARRIPGAHADVVAGRWNREAWQGVELRGRRIAIVGYGRVGQQVAQMACYGFGMMTAAFERDTTYGNHLEDADVVTVHVPLTPETHHMCDKWFFGGVKRGVLFVNTSRGAIVDENALLDALLRGHLAGAALDVVGGEPNVSPALLDYARTHDNLILTPHLGGNTRESREKTQLHIAAKIAAFVEEREAVASVLADRES